ncbi:MAG: hypothetical protein KTR22_13020 [Flavobacteriaceae bacterium]|nr:hypothetical protein [Flavobacteriaceae bacterium]
MKTEILKWLLITAGLGQITTAIIYPFVRYNVLNWFTDLKNLSPLNEAIAKTYGYYIQGINFFFGILSLFLFTDLIEHSNLSTVLTGFIAVYWIGRISFQLKNYSFDEISSRKHYTKGIWMMNGLISFFAFTYSLIFIHHIIFTVS